MGIQEPLQMSKAEIESALQIRAWGQWIRKELELPRLARPSWHKLVPSEYADDEPMPEEIAEDYAHLLTARIACMTKRKKQILYGKYVFRLSVEMLRKKYRCRKSAVIEYHESALNELYNSLLDNGNRGN